MHPAAKILQRLLCWPLSRRAAPVSTAEVFGCKLVASRPVGPNLRGFSALLLFPPRPQPSIERACCRARSLGWVNPACPRTPCALPQCGLRARTSACCRPQQSSPEPNHPQLGGRSQLEGMRCKHVPCKALLGEWPPKGGAQPSLGSKGLRRRRPCMTMPARAVRARGCADAARLQEPDPRGHSLGGPQLAGGGEAGARGSEMAPFAV
jgi:hypothetical protein